MTTYWLVLFYFRIIIYCIKYFIVVLELHVMLCDICLFSENFPQGGSGFFSSFWCFYKKDFIVGVWCIYFCYSSIIRTIIRMTRIRRVIRLEHLYFDRREMDGCSSIIPCYYTTQFDNCHQYLLIIAFCY